jgi:alpha-galactosidase
MTCRLSLLGRAAAALLVGVVTAALTACAAPPSTTAEVTAARLATPPMGWNSWNYFGCSVTEADVKAAADAIVADGLRAVGYEYVNVDDCWQAPTRDGGGRLRSDPERFPDGIAALAAYVHGKGLKFGIYAAPGSRTCAERYQGYPGRIGSLGHVEQDARTFASWGVDYLKYDWCGADRDGVGHEQAFAQMRAALNATGRRIVFSIHDKPEQPAPAWRHWVSDLSRSTPDVQDSWDSVISIVHATLPLQRWRPPGFWNDPDMLEIGNGGMNADEERSHFALWAQLSAPLLIGCDLGSASQGSLRILGASRVIGVDQDRLGAAPAIVASSREELVLLKPLSDGSFALTITNLADHARTATVTSAALGVTGRLTLEDLWTGEAVDVGARIRTRLSAHATAMYRLASATAVATAP